MTLQTSAVLVGHTERVWSVRWHPQGQLLASCSADKTIRLWQQQGDEWQCRWVLGDAHERTIRSINWSSCGEFLVSTGFDALTCVWAKKEDEWQCLVTLEGHENEVKSAAWSHSGKFLATCSRDKTVWIWEKVSSDEYECASVQSVHTQDVKRVVWHPTDDLLVSCGYDNTIRFYREVEDDWDCVETLKYHDSTVWALAFDSSGRKMASTSTDKTVKIWKSSPEDGNWKCACTLSGFHQRPVFDVSWCKSNDHIVTASGDNSICVFKPDHLDGLSSENDSLKYILVCQRQNAHETDVNSVDWHPTDGRVFASAGDDLMVRIWTVDDC